jgi:hypothetical protein
MKSFYLLILFPLISTVSTHAQFYLHTGYSAGVPQQEMKKNIGAIHQINMGAAWRLPGNLKGVELIADMNYGLYGNTSKLQTFTFRNGTSTQTMVNYSSSMALAALGTRFSPFSRRNISPYIGVRGGYTEMFSSIYIEDPRDPLGCRALDNESIISDGTWFSSWSSGIKLNWNLFGKKTDKKSGWIDIGIQQTRGGRLSYINTRRLQDEAIPAAGNRSPLEVQFINASTQEIHEHQVAEVFNTPFRMFELRISAIFSLNVFK